MMGQRDPLALLRAANPVREPELSGLASSEAAVALLRRIVAEPRPDPTPRPPRAPVRRPRLVPAMVAAIVCVGAVAYAVANRPASKPVTVSCYATVDLSAAAHVIAPLGRGPAQACADLWAQGAFGAPTFPVLAECVLPSGIVGVFPVGTGNDACRALNLPPVSGPPPTSGSPGSGPSPGHEPDAAFGAFQKAALDRFLASPCVEPDQGRTIVREELDRAGLKGWTLMDSAAFTPARPCATLAFNPPGRQILLVPTPGR